MHNCLYLRPIYRWTYFNLRSFTRDLEVLGFGVDLFFKAGFSHRANKFCHHLLIFDYSIYMYRIYNVRFYCKPMQGNVYRHCLVTSVSPKCRLLCSAEKRKLYRFDKSVNRIFTFW